MNDPQSIHASAWVAPSAQIYGKVTIARDVSVWHNAVMRAECEEIAIRIVGWGSAALHGAHDRDQRLHRDASARAPVEQRILRQPGQGRGDPQH